MRVVIALKSVAEYITEVEMSEAEYEEYMRRIDSRDARVTDDIVQEFSIDLADPTSWTDIEVDRFDAVSD